MMGCVDFSTTEPISAAQREFDLSRRSRTWFLFVSGTEIRSPPEVWASARSSFIAPETFGPKLTEDATLRRFFLVPPGTHSFSMSSRTSLDIAGMAEALI